MKRLLTRVTRGFCTQNKNDPFSNKQLMIYCEDDPEAETKWRREWDIFDSQAYHRRKKQANIEWLHAFGYAFTYIILFHGNEEQLYPPIANKITPYPYKNAYLRRFE